MEIKFSEELRGVLEMHGKDLQIQGRYSKEKDILDTYLNGAYGNAYDFNKQDWLVEVF